MESISDGQMFCIIPNGSPGTGMMAYSSRTDNEVWQLVLYVREFAH